ncbi:MAG: hypothetical protein WCW87_02675 [Candidatus Paceibacterota bacterium]
MDSLKETYKKNKSLHHAYCFQAQKHKFLPELLDFLESDLKFKIQGNPDFWFKEIDSFGIDESRELKERHILKSSLGGKKIFVLVFNFITLEAQNSLLKIFEEPTEDTHFFIIIPSLNILLPTLKSRLLIIEDARIDNDDLKNANKFLKSNGGERLKMVKNIVEEISDEEKSKIDAINFINDLEICIHEKFEKSHTKEEAFILEEIIKCRSYLYDRSSSVKIILEYLALIIPR